MPRKRKNVFPVSSSRAPVTNLSIDPIARPEFTSLVHREHYTRLFAHSFRILCSIDWVALQISWHKHDVERLLSVGKWHKLLTRRSLLIAISRWSSLPSLNRNWDVIFRMILPLFCFQLLGLEYHFSYTELALQMGLYTFEYISSTESRTLIFSPPLGECQCTRWKWLYDYGLLFRPSLTSATMLKSPALQVVHTLLSGTIIGRSHAVDYISSTEFKYLLSMVDRTPYHLGVVIVESFHHQATDSWSHSILQDY